jgi:hypothetical protein
MALSFRSWCPSPGIGLRFASLAAVCALSATCVTPASASTVTVGPDLSAAVGVNTFSCNVVGGCTYSQESPSYVSPVSGAIVRWRVLRGHGPLTLRVIDGNTGGASSATVEPSAETLETFPTDLPIQAGQRIGIDLPAGFVSDIGVAQPAGFAVSSWAPSLLSGETSSPDFVFTPFELLLNADVQPRPAISAIVPGNGPLTGNTRVVISGHDLNGAGAVMFGGAPASSFTVDSDGQITAVSPPSGVAGAVPLTVTTVAGTATSPMPFVYKAPPNPAPLVSHCVVPKLKGAKLKASKHRARAADCRIGKVTRKEGVTAKSGRVIKQAPKPGSVQEPGTAIKVRLG